MFYSKRLFVYGFVIFIGLGKPKVCVNLFGIGEPIKFLFKGGGKKKNLTLESFIRFSFWNPSLLLQKKEFLLCFLYAFGFCNQAKSLAPTLKILLVFLREVSHILGFMQKSKPHTRIRASNWLAMYLGAVHRKGNCHYRTSPIGYWVRFSCRLVRYLGFLYL